MNIQIIGGGISGLLTALMARINHYNVTVYEMSSEIGGVLRDCTVDNDWYFHNTQYINQGSLCHQLLKDYVRADLTEFNHEYGSITQQLDNTEVLHLDFAQPVFNNSPPIIDKDQELPKSIDEWLKLYQLNHHFLNAFANKFCDIDNLHLNSIVPMQISRVFYQNNIENVLKQKQSNQVADNIFGLPRSILKPNTAKQKALLPTFGYNKLIQDIENCLNNMGVNIVKNQPITPKLGVNKQMELYVRNQKISADKTLWCGNPTPLIFQATGYKLSNQVLKMYCAVGKCEYIPNITPIYIQVFHLDSSIVRFFLYNDGDVTKITIEGVGHHYDKDKIHQEINDWLTKYFSTKLTNKLSFFNEKRYVLLTNDDYKAICDYTTSQYQSDIVAGGWEVYGRDAKLEILNRVLQTL